jgi:hypothetical protein
MPKSMFADGSATKTAPNHKNLSKMRALLAHRAPAAAWWGIGGTELGF